MTIDVRTAKDELRRAALIRRARISAGERAAAGRSLAQAARPLLPAVVPAKNGDTATIAAYVSMGSEIDLDPLLGLALERGLKVIVPRLGSGRELGWGILTSLDELRTAGRFGSGRERPREPFGPVLDADAVDDAGTILVPALAVDGHGTRVGRGGGWYDRVLTSIPATSTVIAVCWPWEVVDGPLPRETHDVPVDAVLTPEGASPIRRGVPA
ncbi:5-formyltetrahydrofolate cyclo-ligase [uncultured Bifidobacterium sp.]|uniref:5-formyltetrahydrofolate cyclo-ligase n=1 Tax=uncultured Bifidobacterium sp. TaxID=165187 RepID=UPI0028DB3046|nr:5-formyltetrahydrofolate cyclo-ligase [uncultured Bifidobacterium sp.]